MESERQENLFNTTDEPKLKAEEDECVSKIVATFEYYRRFHPKAFPRPHSGMQEWGYIKKRLKDGYTLADLKAAIDGCHRSKFHGGDNDRGKKYQSLELIMRNASKVQQFLEEPDRMRHVPIHVPGKLNSDELRRISIERERLKAERTKNN